MSSAPRQAGARRGDQLRPAFRRTRQRVIRLIDAVLRRRTPDLDDAREVHKLRVAVARLRVALAVLRDPIGRRRRRRLDRALKRLHHALGPLRDLDVLIARLNRRRASPLAAARISEALASRRRQLLHECRHVLDGDETAELRRRLAALRRRVHRSSLWTATHDAEPGPGELAREYLRRRLAKIGARAAGLDRADMAALHRLRLEIKKLRHGAEIFSALVPEPEARLLIARLLRAQDDLGSARDRASGGRQIERLRAHLDRRVHAELRKAQRSVEDEAPPALDRCLASIAMLEAPWLSDPVPGRRKP